MNSISSRPPTSPHGVIRNAQKAMDAGMLRLIDGAGQGASAALGGNSPPVAPVEATPRRGSTVHVVA
ncbi:MAG: hypothetical protein A2V77_23685 [Anaeromyxobacter sp. RBG_16_69_14]|nr:MAG: hypothetical protein A2V77_23685 [Anaeromyxobacter sp. RBG_16_69_14]HJW75877.1 hypothetical protein [Thermoleophilia bacterium]